MISSHHKDTGYDIIYTKEPIRFKGGFITVDNKAWKIYNIIRQEFFLLLNQNVRSKDPTCELQIPSNFMELMDQKPSIKEKNMTQSKKFIFNLNQNDE